MKTNYLLLAVILCVGKITAQQPKILCGDALYKEYLYKTYPGFKESYEATLKQTAELIKTRQYYRTNSTQYTVNVVVHVVWKDPSENLDDSVIYNQIQVLNEDYNRQNADTSNLRAIFQPIAGNAGIHFNLYQIIRKHTDSLFKVSLLSGTMPKNMKFDSLGGSSAIDPAHFLNIWVCKIQPITIGSFTLGQILGFAYPPNNLSNWPSNSGAPTPGEDGVVIDYRCFGRNNPNILTIGSQTITIKGRTPTHEVGHYFGLRHIWGDGGSPLGGGNGCNGNDGIQDTPNANDQSNFDCNKTKNTCLDTNLGWTTVDMPDLVENYMDYAAEDCMNMFTQGQVNWMITTIQGPRNGLLTTIPSVNSAPFKTFIYPNPAKDYIDIQTNVNINSARIIMEDMVGKVLYENTIHLNKGQSRVILPHINQGVYVLKVYNDTFYSAEKIVIE